MKDIRRLTRGIMNKGLNKLYWARLNRKTFVTGCDSCAGCPYVIKGRRGERRCYYETLRHEELCRLA